MRKSHILCVTMMLAVSFIASSVHAGDWYERSETFSVPVRDLDRIDFTGIDFTRFEYRGDAAATEVSIAITYRVHASVPEVADEVLDRFDLDVDRTGDVLRVALDHPRQHNGNIFSMLLRRTWKEWKVEMTITGPVDIDMYIPGDFSNLDIRDTMGTLVLQQDFSDVRLHDHSGTLDAEISFGSLKADRLAGQFTVDCEFSSVELQVSELTRDSAMSVEFGDGEIHLPDNAGVSVTSSRSFGDVGFHMERSVTLNGSNHAFTMNGGGIPLRLDVEFGDINITDRGRTDMSMH